MMFHEIAPHKFDVIYRESVPRETDRVLIYEKGNVFAKTGETLLEFPAAASFGDAAENYLYLFAIDDVRYFTLKEMPETLPEGYSFEERDLRHGKPQHLAYAAMTGKQISGWYRSHRFCGRCGAKTEIDHRDRAVRCPVCGEMSFSQICPSVIVGIRNGDKLLCTKYSVQHGGYRRYALVAGYVEVGETPEETVRREVMEEVGLKVKNIRYYDSSPWPFSGALLLGYICDLDGDDRVTLEEEELSVADWLTREEIEDRSEDISLTSKIMMAFRKGEI